jgi:hypothetical protein
MIIRVFFHFFSSSFSSSSSSLSLSLYREREKKRVVVVGKKYRRRERRHYLSLTCKRVSVNLVLCGTKPKRQRLFFLSLFFSPSPLPFQEGEGGGSRGELRALLTFFGNTTTEIEAVCFAVVRKHWNKIKKASILVSAKFFLSPDAAQLFYFYSSFCAHASRRLTLPT